MRLATAQFGKCPEGMLAVRVSQGRGFGRVDAVLAPAMPSPDLLDRYKHGRASWDEYVPEYLNGLRWEDDRLRAGVAELLIEAESRGMAGLCFLCYEASPAKCHRRLLLGHLATGVLSGYDVEFSEPR